MSKIDTAVANALAIANDSSHGYDQGNRWGPDYDCSSFLITVWQAAGVPVKTAGASYTGNMLATFKKCGFKDVKSSVNVKTGSGLKKGDVLLGNGHVVMYIGSGKIVHASINEFGKITGGKDGDQTGKEICTRSYYNKPWLYVLRYTGDTSNVGQSKNDGILRRGDKGPEVKEMQTDLITAGYDVGPSGADGEFGSDTENGLKAMQRDTNIEADGEYGPITNQMLKQLISGKNTGTPVYVAGKVYTLQSEMKVRTGPGTNYRAKKHSELSADGKKHDSDEDGALNKGTRITCKAYKDVESEIWIQTPSGWICAKSGNKVYIK